MSQLTIEKVPVPNPTGLRNQVHRFMQRTGFAYMTLQDEIALVCLAVGIYYICRAVKRTVAAVVKHLMEK